MNTVWFYLCFLASISIWLRVTAAQQEVESPSVIAQTETAGPDFTLKKEVMDQVKERSITIDELKEKIQQQPNPEGVTNEILRVPDGMTGDTKLALLGFYGGLYSWFKEEFPVHTGVFGKSHQLFTDMRGEILDSLRYRPRYDGDTHVLCSVFLPVSDLNTLKPRLIPRKDEKKYSLYASPDPDSTVSLPYPDSTAVIPGYSATVQLLVNSNPRLVILIEAIRDRQTLEKIRLPSLFQEQTIVKQLQLSAVPWEMWARDNVKHFPKLKESDLCVFCHKVKRAKKEGELSHNSKVLVFPDLYPSGKVHLLAIPTEHTIRSINDLSKKHVPLLKNMKAACQERLKSMDIDPRKATYGFHVPPNISVGHLHLHCVVDIFPHREYKFDPEHHKLFVSYDDIMKNLNMPVLCTITKWLRNECFFPEADDERSDWFP